MEHALTLFLFFRLAAMTGTLAGGIHIRVHPGKPCVGVLMAGPYGKRMLDNGRGHMGAVYAGSLYSHMVEPLLPQFRIELMISSEPGESAAWAAWSQQLESDVYVQISEGAPLPERNETRFADTLCNHSCHVLWLQYGHLHNSYAMLRQREPSMWPNGMNDQIVFGPRAAMDRYFNILWSKTSIPSQYPQGPESVVSRYLISCNVSVVTVELQVSRPGCQNMPDCSAVNGMPEYGWVTTPCKLCMTA